MECRATDIDYCKLKKQINSVAVLTIISFLFLRISALQHATAHWRIKDHPSIMKKLHYCKVFALFMVKICAKTFFSLALERVEAALVASF
jgi:hypothetical protein